MKKAKEILGFDDTWLMLIGIPVVSFLINGLMFPEILVNDITSFIFRCGSVGMAYTIIYWITFRQTVLFFKSRFPSQADFKKRLAIQTVSVIILYFIIKIILDPVIKSAVSSVTSDFTKEHGVSMTIAGLTVSFLAISVYETFSFYFQLQNEQLERERLMKANIQGQLEGLKNQVNPHFFFNSLNTLAYLIPENPEKAENFVQKLSKAYRYILEIRDKETVTVEEELNFLDSYTCLLKERFGENLNIKIDVPEHLLKMGIVPLSMQMLFENAIKHNIVSTQDPLSIEVSAEKGNQLVVKNNLQRKQQVMNSTKVGLENIKKRYRLLSDKNVEVFATQQSFIVVLPLLKKDVQYSGTT